MGFNWVPKPAVDAIGRGYGSTGWRRRPRLAVYAPDGQPLNRAARRDVRKTDAGWLP
jgi:hypothetical protein